MSALTFLLLSVVCKSACSSDKFLVSPEGQCEGTDNRIPLLKEVFEAFPETPVNIDIKMNNNVLIRKVHENLLSSE